MLREVLNQTRSVFDEVLHKSQAQACFLETGEVIYVGQGVALVRGLPEVQSQELVRFVGGLFGIAFNLEPEGVGVVLLGASERLAAGTEARRTGRVVSAPVGPGLLGRVVDALGRPLDALGAVRTIDQHPIESEAPAILDRAPVTTPLATGIKAIDALIPVGRGQRELILGDRQTGKTTIVLDTIINQRETGVICIYCAIGQRTAAVAKVIAALRAHQAMDHSVVVVASGEDPPGLQYITPYAATTIAEYFMAQGQDVMIVYDDLTRHARAYRELSLLLRRPPGREAYPGDIFYIHSRLLERSTHLCEEHGGGSLTALPICETEAQNISAYIPTNLISITDGQIYLSPDLFQKGVLPAIDVGKSVSRVGGKAQIPAYRAVAAALRLSYSQFEELETFARFGTRLDDVTRHTIEHGRRVREVLKQPEHQLLSACEQVVILLAVTNGLFDELPLERIRAQEKAIRWAVADQLRDVCRKIHDGDPLSASDRDAILRTAREALWQRRGDTPETKQDASAGSP